jgi:hypothetical protein
MKIIVNESFVSRTLLISRLYKVISDMEKKAQGSCFGPFEYKYLVDSLVSELQDLKTPCIELTNFMKNGNLESIIPWSSTTSCNAMNLNEISLKLAFKTRRDLEKSRNEIPIDLLDKNCK